jgi:hypothetical protein
MVDEPACALDVEGLGHRADEGAFHFLGSAEYVKHEGELPMAVTWRLQHPLPGDLFVSFAAAVA